MCSFRFTKMSSSWNLCQATCPPSTVTIQPPPFVLTIPGPALYCTDQPLCIDQYNPCAYGYGGLTDGRYTALSSGRAFGSSVISPYARQTQSRGSCSSGSCRPY
uniref:Uncharacterized protein n=1 Tax=Sphenodon punctatus TaxID=8508 RepID=A0A8D0GY91_SPHPU